MNANRPIGSVVRTSASRCIALLLAVRDVEYALGHTNFDIEFDPNQQPRQVPSGLWECQFVVTVKEANA